ncbi:unnamed protein product [Ilex paraguariensis]|uniref:Uncharacterized protein n=1 Tax=Ilex paraguariensis TaxID=185542 RepID=A0ABC8TLY9_9AQUA
MDYSDQGSILMNIVDDGSTNYGYYPRLNFNCVNMLRFVNLGSFLSVLGELGSVSFDNLHTGSARAKLLDLLGSQFSFKPNTRFPSSELYVCLDRGPVLGEIAIMLRVLATPSRLMTESSIKEYFSSVESKQCVMYCFVLSYMVAADGRGGKLQGQSILGEVSTSWVEESKEKMGEWCWFFV